jgi:hypothetical protein
MTEQEWLGCADPRQLIDFISPRTSKRKLRLFACACCRHVGHVLQDEEIRKAPDAAERYADGRIQDSTAHSWFRRARAARDRLPSSPNFTIQGMAYHAVTSAVIPNQYGAYLWTHQEVAGESRTARAQPG